MHPTRMAAAALMFTAAFAAPATAQQTRYWNAWQRNWQSHEGNVWQGQHCEDDLSTPQQECRPGPAVWAVDSNGDGYFEKWVWQHSNGRIITAIDSNSDGQWDSVTDTAQPPQADCAGMKKLWELKYHAYISAMQAGDRARAPALYEEYVRLYKVYGDTCAGARGAAER
jgi:hypothetical protein